MLAWFLARNAGAFYCFQEVRPSIKHQQQRSTAADRRSEQKGGSSL
jgi:hypothetical protein